MHRLLSIATMLLAIPALATAQTAASKPPPSAYDKLWDSFTELYDDESNPAVERVLLSGRFHYDIALLDADQGDDREGNIRRLRIGPRITLFRNWLLHSEIELDPQRHNPLYTRFTDFYVQWTKSPRVVLTMGKQSMPFTLDGSTSSREVLTIDRSNLANNLWFPQEYIPGISVSGRRAPWIYRGGVYSSGAMTREFGRFNGSTSTLATLGYDMAPRLGAREAVLTGNYVYQTPNVNNTFTRQLRHIGSLNFRFENTRWGVRTDLAAAKGYLGQPDLRAFQGMPFVNLTDRFQAVGRYTYIKSDGPDGIRLNLYESRIVPGRGDEYNEIYLGANYYFYGHRLKVQTGLQFADMNDRANNGGAYSGVSWVTGLRVGW